MSNIPKHVEHVGIILDGNGRWAVSRGLSRLEGHLAGYENLKKLVPFILDRVDFLTVYAFSTENWSREKKEVEGIFDLFALALEESMPKLIEEGTRIKFIGDRARLSKNLRQGMHDIEEKSLKIGNESLRGTFIVAINYGGQDEIVHAIKEIVVRNVHPAYINKRCISGFLYTKDIPDPDLIIRTACKPGEMRLSDFLTWQAAHAELYASRKYFPEFSKVDFKRALRAYSTRERLRGGDRVA